MENAKKERMEQLAKRMSEKQKAFCDHYIVTLNQTEAARLAGYSDPWEVRTLQNLTLKNI